MSQAPPAVCLNCSRPATARTLARPAAMWLSVAPALAAAAAAASALATLCAPAEGELDRSAAVRGGQLKRVRKPCAATVVRTSVARKSAA